jgi:hypothetical protein
MNNHTKTFDEILIDDILENEEIMTYIYLKSNILKKIIANNLYKKRENIVIPKFEKFFPSINFNIDSKTTQRIPFEIPKTQDPKNNDPKIQDPKNQGPKNQDPKIQDPKIQDTKIQDIIKDPKNNDPKIQDTKNQDILESPKNDHRIKKIQKLCRHKPSSILFVNGFDNQDEIKEYLLKNNVLEIYIKEIRIVKKYDKNISFIECISIDAATTIIEIIKSNKQHIETTKKISFEFSHSPPINFYKKL